MLNTSLSPWPSFTQEEADAVSKVLLSNKVNYWTGTECREFEKEFAAFVGTQYAVALSNGTLALDVALKAMDIGQGDDVRDVSCRVMGSVEDDADPGTAMPGGLVGGGIRPGQLTPDGHHRDRFEGVVRQQTVSARKACTVRRLSRPPCTK